LEDRMYRKPDGSFVRMVAGPLPSDPAIEQRSALITYTINGAGELSKTAYAAHRGAVPPHITISTWYAFLLRHFVRPYQNDLYAPRVARINFIRGQSARFTKASDIRRH